MKIQLKPVTHILLTLLIIVPSISVAAVMEGNTFKISRDSVSAGGGLGVGGIYKARDTIGESVVGESSSGSYVLKSGYQETLVSYISITAAEEGVVMDELIGGLSGGESNGSFSVRVTTDNSAGYQMFMSATAGPAMRSSSNSIGDYQPVADADLSFVTNQGDSHFGYSVFGDDVTSIFHSDGSQCGVGTSNAESCWKGLSTTNELVAESIVSNHPLGTETLLEYRVGIGAGAVQLPGNYVATTTITVLPR